MVTHPSTNRAQHRLTSLIETNVLPLHQTAIVTNTIMLFVAISIITEGLEWTELYPYQTTLPVTNLCHSVSMPSRYLLHIHMTAVINSKFSSSAFEFAIQINSIQVLFRSN